MICSLILRRPLLAKGDERFQARDIVASLKSAVDSKIKDQTNANANAKKKWFSFQFVDHSSCNHHWSRGGGGGAVAEEKQLIGRRSRRRSIVQEEGSAFFSGVAN